MTWRPRLTPWERGEGSLYSLHRKVDHILTKEQDLETLLGKLDTTTNTLAAGVSAVNDAQDRANAEIAALKDQIANGTPVTQEQLDSLGAKLAASTDSLGTIAASLTAIGANT